ncbi:anti-sigma factor domain-containing protein [Brevundimonas sp.]|uniref:anti-sigma factor n=1 Tax=Brevundimonas sp. TaxID=1871086 RepID=UPI00286BD6A2|nr:anti-sigma factor [Brevundimonas sp.]
MTDLPPDDTGADDALAGELALRVLSPAEERAARAREASDPAFAAEVEVWNEHLAGFIAEIPSVQPSPRVWPRIEAGIAPVAANDNRAGFWRMWALGSTGLLAASLVAVALLATRPTPAPIVQTVPTGGVTRVATIAMTDGGTPVVALAYDSATGNLFIAPTDAMDGASAVPHLWLIKPGEAGVQLIGAIDGSTASHHHLTDVLASTAGQAVAVAISMEAPGHTPAGDKPDGPVVATGELQAL